MKIGNNSNFKEEYRLDNTSIANVDHRLEQFLADLEIDSKESIRIRLSIEEILLIWAETLGENSKCTLSYSELFGKRTLMVAVPGMQFDPTTYENSVMSMVINKPNLLAAMGAVAEYIYNNGQNIIKIALPKKQGNTFVLYGISIAAAVVLGLIFRCMLPQMGMMLVDNLINPLFDTIIRMFQLIAGPLIFLSILSGMLEIGDISDFGKIGKGLIKNAVINTFIISVLSIVFALCIVPFEFANGASGAGELKSVVDIVLDVVPNNIIEPFQTGNAMQIIFISICIGCGFLVLGKSVSNVTDFLLHLNVLVQYLMTLITKILPVFIFLCCVNLVMTSDITKLTSLVIPLVMTITLCFVYMIATGVHASYVTKIPVKTLFKYQFPTWVIATSTASSAASYASNIECCTEKLRIDKKLTYFGIPFGQVIYMPSTAIEYSVMSICMAVSLGLPLNILFIVKTMVLSTILAIATPPIPGGAITCFTIILSELGISLEVLPLVITVDIFLDYVATGTDVVSLQHLLLVFAKKKR